MVSRDLQAEVDFSAQGASRDKSFRVIEMSTGDYPYEPRLGHASTLPSEWYRDPAILQLEKERIFSRTWQLVGRSSQVESPGDYFTASIGDEPIIVVNDHDGYTRAFSNVCRHRAGPVARGEGNRRVFQCGYHGWTYTLDGRLHRAPEFEGVECFDLSSTCLPAFLVERWAGLVFVNLDVNGGSPGEVFDELSPRIDPASLESLSLAARKDWVVECNWKVYVDNYLEGYHIPMVHPSLNRELDYQNYRVETGSLHSIQHSPIKRLEGGRLLAEPDGENAGVHYFWVFPNLMLNVYPDNFSTNLILPLGPERTVTIFEWYFRDPLSDATGKRVESTIAFSDEIQLEDIGICEEVQRGLRSRTYDRGRYSVRRENGVHHFHGLVDRFLRRD